MVWAALWSAGGCLPFWVPEMQGGRETPPGLSVLSMSARGRGDGLPGMDGAGNVPAAICWGNSVVFNQQLTIFLVVAMVWRLTVSALCAYWQSRRCWRLFRFPWAWVAVDGLRGGLGG